LKDCDGDSVTLSTIVRRWEDPLTWWEKLHLLVSRSLCATRTHPPVKPSSDTTRTGEPATFHGRKWATKFVIGGASVLAFLARNRLKPSDAQPY